MKRQESPDSFSDYDAVVRQAFRQHVSKSMSDLNRLSSIYQKNDTSLDSRAIWRAFRLISGPEGITDVELRKALMKLPNRRLHADLEKTLDELFRVYNTDGGNMDALEFQTMINQSTLMEAAIYEFLQFVDNDVGETSDWQVDKLEITAVVIILLNSLIMAISTDCWIGWYGWTIIELCFLAAFICEILFKMYLCGKRSAELKPHKLRDAPSFLKDAFLHFFREPMNILDVVITILAGADVFLTILGVEANSLFIFTALRMFRLARLGRLIKVIFFFRDLTLLIVGVFQAMRLIIWSFVLIALMMFIWALLIRQNVSSGSIDTQGSLDETFPNIPVCMQVMFRCVVLNAHGACTDKHGMPLHELLSEHIGWFFGILWMVTEVFICFGMLNVVSSIFVVQAMTNDSNVRHKVDMLRRQHDNTRLRRLDKLLRSLTHPHRHKANPKDRNAAKVASYLRTSHPEVVKGIQDLPKKLIGFAQEIKESKESYHNAMMLYEAADSDSCDVLFSVPNAQLYLENGHEVLRVDSMTSLCGNVDLGLAAAPDGAVKVQLFQQQSTLPELLQEAEEVLLHVKSLIWPGSDWAMKTGSRSSGDIWLASSKLCDEAYDPGVKRASRSQQKVEEKYAGRYERNRDYCRLGLMYSSPERLLIALKTLLEFRLDTEEGFEVAGVENRFAEPTPLGWRDITLWLRVRVPSSGRYHVMEMQMWLQGLKEARNKNHEFYEKLRLALPEDAVSMVIDQLTTYTTLDLGITKQEWLQCLQNDKVQKILDELGISNHIRRDVIDVVDSDGSGTVTTMELRSGLMQCRGNPQAHDLVDCRLKIREMQQWLVNRLEPQMRLLQFKICEMSMSLGPPASMTQRYESACRVAHQHSKMSDAPQPQQDQLPRESSKTVGIASDGARDARGFLSNALAEDGHALETSLPCAFTDNPLPSPPGTPMSPNVLE